MKDYRLKENRQEAFERYYVAMLRTGDIDPYPVMNWLFEKRYAKTAEDRYWWAFLYANTYCVSTVFYITSFFPKYPPDFKSLEAWHKDNWKKLHYETDCQYNKGHLVEMVADYIYLVGESQCRFFDLFITGNPKEDFEILWVELQKLHKFGRYITYFYTETLARCCRLPISCGRMMFGKKSVSHTRGMMCLLGIEDQYWETSTWTPALLKYLDRNCYRVMNSIRRQYPGTPVDEWYMETVLCAYKGFFKRRRYLGYYLDRDVRQIKRMTERSEGEVDYFPLRLCFDQLTPPRLNGFKGGWDGPRKKLSDVYLDTGRLVNIDIWI